MAISRSSDKVIGLSFTWPCSPLVGGEGTGSGSEGEEGRGQRAEGKGGRGEGGRE